MDGWVDGLIDRQVLTAIAPVILVVGLLQPLNSYVFIGDGILQGSQDFVYEVRGTPSPVSSLVPPPPPPAPRPVFCPAPSGEAHGAVSICSLDAVRVAVSVALQKEVAWN